MANCIAHCTGYDRTRTKEAHRLGSVGAKAQANTWHTFTTCEINSDGSGLVKVERHGKTIHEFSFGPEHEPEVVDPGATAVEGPDETSESLVNKLLHES